MNTNSRPVPPPSFVLTCDRIGVAATVVDGDGAARSTNSAVTTRRGCPATVTMKSAGVRPRSGRPCLSTTPTSTVTTSTPLRNAGGCWSGAACCADSERPADRQERRTDCHRHDADENAAAECRACVYLPAR